MTRYLLDTCVFLDWAIDPKRLSDSARVAIGNGRSIVHVSAASVWEIAIKSKLGKLNVPSSVATLITDNRFSELDVSCAHAMATSELPFIHNDPFDRLLVAQAKVEQLTLITRDRELLKYEVQTIAA